MAGPMGPSRKVAMTLPMKLMVAPVRAMRIINWFLPIPVRKMKHWWPGSSSAVTKPRAIMMEYVFAGTFPSHSVRIGSPKAARATRMGSEMASVAITVLEKSRA